MRRHVYTRFPFSRMEEFRAAKRLAREQGRGLWTGQEHASALSPARGLVSDPKSRDCIPAEQCCKVCSKGKACGNSCISASYMCHRGKGCACEVEEICR